MYGTSDECEGKVCFEDFRIASQAAGRRGRRTVYRCKACRAFHVGGNGSRPNNRPRDRE